MLIRNHDGKLIEIKKHDFVSDSEYYKTIMKIKNKLYKRHSSLDMFNTQDINYHVISSKTKSNHD